MRISTETLRGKPIAILGNGVTGKGIAKLLDGNSNYRIFDQRRFLKSKSSFFFAGCI